MADPPRSLASSRQITLGLHGEDSFRCQTAADVLEFRMSKNDP